jgi:hypothetical protein
MGTRVTIQIPRLRRREVVVALVGDWLTLLQALADAALGLRAVIGREDLCQRPASHLVGRVAQQALNGRVVGLNEEGTAVLPNADDEEAVGIEPEHARVERLPLR